MPNLFLIAGPNGAGKTTTHGKILSDDRRVDAFVNADEIAADLRRAGIASTDIRAGRLMLDRIADACTAVPRHCIRDNACESRPQAQDR